MFSIILPAYKSTYLKTSIESILSQSYQDFELIVVNDNPGSEIKNIVSKFHDDRLTYIENAKNIGRTDLVKCWNLALQYATREFVILASDDDIYEPEYLAEISSLISLHPGIDLFHCRIRYFNEKGDTILISPPAFEVESDTEFAYQRICNSRKQALQEFCFRTAKLTEMGGIINFPLAWYSDDATLIRMARNGVAYSPKLLFNMRMSGQNLSTLSSHPIEKIAAMKSFIFWFQSYLPALSEITDTDIFQKQRLKTEFKNYIYNHYSMYLPALNFRDFLKECSFIAEHRIYSKNFVLKMKLRRLLNL